LETALDAKLSTYSKIASTITRAGAGGYKLVEEEIDELLSKVRFSLTTLHLIARERRLMACSWNRRLMI
jgi:Golgi SNAP receptor complex protein 1